jgi:D-alanine transaminase
LADILYINGRYTTTDEKVIGVEDRGFQFGDGIYEVIKFLDHRLIFRDRHFRRLASGLEELEIPSPWDEISFDRMCERLLEGTPFPDGILYIQVTRGETERAHFYPDDLSPTALAYTRRFRFPDAEKKERGIRVITLPESRWAHCNVKSTNLLANALAKKKAQRAGAEEAIFIETDGDVREGAGSSFFIVREGRIVTHPTTQCILPGTVRDEVISIAFGARIRVDERPITEHELYSLDEAFITSTTQGVMPVTRIDGRVIGNGRRGEITRQLQEELDRLERSVS